VKFLDGTTAEDFLRIDFLVLVSGFEFKQKFIRPNQLHTLPVIRSEVRKEKNRTIAKHRRLCGKRLFDFVASSAFRQHAQ
jgi:hypothetical protein